MRSTALPAALANGHCPLPAVALAPSASDRCNLTCTQRESAIVVSSRMPAEGLNDRATTLTALAQLAHSLCAWLVAPNPCKLLNRRHNDGRKLPCSLWWDRYLNLSFRYGPYGPVPLSEAEYRVRKPARPLVIRGSGHVIDQYAAALTAAEAKAPFEWIVSRPIFVWMTNFRQLVGAHERARVASHLRQSTKPCPWPPRVSLSPSVAETSCNFVLGESSFSQAVLRLRYEFLRTQSLRPREFDAVHLRRRLDALNGCGDTNPDSVRAFVQRSMPNLSRPLLVYMDTQSSKYTRQLRAVLRPKPVVAMDHILKHLPATKGDNFLVFATASSLAAISYACFQLGYKPCGKPLQVCHRHATWRP